jgi:hypothetical protein
VKAFSAFIGIEAARRNPLARFDLRAHLDDLIFGLAISVRMRVLRESRGGHDARNKKAATRRHVEITRRSNDSPMS